MKILSYFITIYLVFEVMVACYGQQAGQTPINLPSPTTPTILSRTANSRIWGWTGYEQGQNGQVIPQVHQYTEVASGLCYQQNGQWLDSQERISILPDGSAAATNGQHQVYFPGNIYNGVITLITPDGTQLQSRPIGLSYSCGSNSVLIAVLTNSIGELISSNQVLYPDAFVGVKADLLYTYTVGGLEQDIIIEEQPATPEDFNLNSTNSSLQMMTEFFNAPQPTVTGESDDWLGFGTMEMVPGKAFLLGTNEQDVGIKVEKSWVNVSGRQILVEQVPVMALADELSQLPLPQNATAKVNIRSPLNVVSAKRLLPEPRPIQTSHQPLLVAKTKSPSKGVVLDYVILNSLYSNAHQPFTFQGDTTYYVSRVVSIVGAGGTVIEGGSVIKYANNPSVYISIQNNLTTPINVYRPAIFTSMNDNSVGEPISGSTGNPTNTGACYLSISFQNIPANAMLSNLRFSYAGLAVGQSSQGMSYSTSYPVWNCQFINCGTAVSLNDYEGENQLTLNLYNVLFSNCGTVLTNGDVFYGGEIKLAGQNVTVDNANILVGTWTLGYTYDTDASASTLTNSILTGVQHQISFAGAGTSYGLLIFTNGCYVGSSAGIYQTAGAGSYYLATNSPCRSAGTATMSPALLAELRQGTTWAPTVYASTNITSILTLGPCVQRDTNSSPDMGYHHDPLDYVFGGCNVSNSLTFTAGTAVGWFETNGVALSSPYAISLGDGANLSFSGTATQPCYFSRYTMVQEGGNSTWTNAGLGGIIMNGSGNSPQPVLSGFFTKWTVDDAKSALNGNSPFGTAGFLDSEFYDASLALYVSSVNFSNCLFYRDLTDFYDQYTNTAFVFQNCTFYNGGLAMARTSSYPPLPWTIENTSFDGTDFRTNDYWNGTTNTLFDYNAYNTNNFSWTNYANLTPPTNGTLEVIGAKDVMVTNYNWESSWFGDFYLPTNSHLIAAGSTNANDLGLYHFTTQTNQTVEGTNIVDIGYHYVATDTNGVPLSTPGDGIPDYIADANGNGIDDTNERPWDIGFQSEPQSTNIAQGQNVTFSATVGGIGPFTYQWLLNSNPIAGATSSSYTILIVPPTDDSSNYSIIASNLDGHVESTNAILWVSTPVALSGGPNGETVTNGGNASFSVTNSSGNHLNYQWYYYPSGAPLENGGRFGGVTTSNLTISSVQPSDETNYFVVVSNVFNSLASPLATLTVITNPVISSVSPYPNTNAIQSEDVTFIVTDSGEQSNQWWFSNSIINTNIVGATGTNYTQLVIQTTNDGLYYVIASSLAGSTNDGATLNVLVPPWITNQPTNVTVNQGNNATFSISAYGTTNLSYQWFENATNLLSNETNVSLLLNNVQTTNAGGYSCVVSNIAGTNMSAWAWLSVTAGGTTTNGWGTNSSQPTPLPAISMNSPTNTSPTNPAVFPYGFPISIRANADSQYGEITNVAFYFTGTNSGPGTNFIFAGNAVPGPNGVFALAWGNALPGTNILKAVAYDYNGQTNVSTNLTYVVMTVPPSVSDGPNTNLVWTEGFTSITNAMFGVITNDGQPTTLTTNISWGATGPGTVTFSPTNSLSPLAVFSTNGSYTVTFSVNNGYVTGSASCIVNVERRPIISFITPTNNEPFLTNTPVVLKVSTFAYDGSISNVTFYTTNTSNAQTNILPGMQSLNDTYDCLWTSAPLWTNLIFAVATDNDGLTSTTPVSVVVGPPLAVWMTAPSNGQLFVFSPTNLLLTATVTSFVNATVTNVVFTNLTQSIGLGAGIEQNDSSWQSTWYYATNGTNTITVTAGDNAGDIATNAVTIIINAMPTVSITNPANLQSFFQVTNVLLRATAFDSDGMVTNVQFYAYSTAASNSLVSLNATNASGNYYDFVWTNRTAGSYPIVAVATDNRGASTVSGITVFDVTPTNWPSVEITYPTNDEVFADGSDITITATVTNDAASVTNVEFFVNGQSIGSDPDSPYGITECCWQPGIYQLAAVATDNTGSSSVSSNVEITVVQESPTDEGFWDAAFCPPAYDECSNSVELYGSESSAVYGGNYYIVGYGRYGDYYSYSLYQFDGTNWFRWGSLADLNGDPSVTPCNYLPLNHLDSVAVNSTGIYVGGELPDNNYGVIQVVGTNVVQLGGEFVPGVYDYYQNPTNSHDSDFRFYKHPQLQMIGTDIYLLGNFSYQEATNIQFISKWNPSTTNWQQVGDSLNAPVFAAGSYNGNLVVGGMFTNADGNTNANNIAELINDGWVNLGLGIRGNDCVIGVSNADIPSVVLAIASCGSELFVGGDFTSAGNQTNVNSVAVWNGTAWNSIAGGLQLHAESGYGNDPPNGIYSWPDIGNNFPGYVNPAVYAVVPHGDSRIFVGGNLTGAVNSDGASVPGAGIMEATWSQDQQQWLWSNMGVGIFSYQPENGTGPYEYLLPYGTPIDTINVLESSTPGPYDVIVSELYSDSNVFGDQPLTVGPYLGPFINTFGGVARWRVGYPQPPSAPTITITNPVNFAVFTNDPVNTNNLIIVANAMSSYTNIAQVSFFVDGNNVGIDQTKETNSFYCNWPSGPGTNEVGPHVFIASAMDGAGLVGDSAEVVIDIKNPTNTITAVNDHYTISVNSPSIDFSVLTNDVPSVGLKISGVVQPNAALGTVAISYDQTYLIYKPLANEYGTDIFFYTVTNSSGAMDSAAVTVNILPQPEVSITPPPYDFDYIPAQESPLAITGVAYATGASNIVTNVDLSIISASGTQSVNLTPVNSQFAYNWTNGGPGFYVLSAVATDANGMTNTSLPVTFSLYNSNIAPSTVTALISNLSPTNSTEDGFTVQSEPVVTQGIFDLQGEASDSIATNPISYQVLLYQPISNLDEATSDPNYQAFLYTESPPMANLTPGPLNSQGFHIGGDNNGDLGTLDFSGIPNGVYVLVLSVRGGADETNSLAEFQLNSSLKVGKFVFSEEDLNLPVNGIPITVTRTYDSQNLNSADFGYGWTLMMNSMNVQLDEQRQNITPIYGGGPSGDGYPQQVSVRTGGGWDVTLTLPNGQQTTFDFSVILDGLNGYQTVWNAPSYIHAKLTPLVSGSDTINTIPYVYWSGTDGMGYNNAPIQNQDFPGWILTTKPDNTQYYLTRTGGQSYDVLDPAGSGNTISARVYGPPVLTKIVAPSQNAVIINTNSIYHLDPSGTNKSDVVNITRDGQGRITTISDPNATNGLPLVQYVYDQDNGNLIQVLKLQNRNTGLYATNHYDYNNPNFPHLITSIENANGVPVTRNYYDSLSRLIQTVDALGNTNQFIYATTNLELTIDPLGRTNSFVYDANGNVIAQTNALGQVTQMTYDGFNDKTNQITFLNGLPYATNSYFYDPSGTGLLLSSTDPLGHTNGFTYNDFGEPLSSSDARGDTTYNGYDSFGDLTSSTDALKDVTVNVYNDGLLTSSTDPVLTTTANYYDNSGNLTNTATLDVSGAILSSNTYTYDANNNRLTSTVWRHAGANWTPATTTNIYDAQNRVIETINPDGGTNTVIYNLIGQQAETIDPLGNTTTYTYDPAGHLIQTQYPDFTTETSAYDAAGNRTNSLDQLQRPTSYIYDALNRVTNTIYADGSTSATVYDSVGRVAQTIDARGTITASAYDVAGRRIAVTNAFGFSGISSTNFYAYDANGNQITFTDANGHTTTNVYDALNRQTQVQYPDGTATETVYDGDGHSIIQTNQDGFATYFAYDGAGRLIAVTNALNQVTQYQYDEAGNEIAQIDALLRTNTYAYDGQGRRISHTMPGGQSEGFAYDLDGNQHYGTNFNGAVITNAYDENNRLTNVSSIFGYNVTYAYSATGQRTNMVDPSGAYTYAYDNRDRLLQKTVNWNNGPSNSLNYDYDQNGNVTNIASGRPNGVNLFFAYDPLNRLTNVLANGAAAATYAYDLAGNLQALRYGNGVTNQYQYDSLNRLTNLIWSLPAGTLAKFSYQLGLTGNRTNLNETVGGTNRLYAWQYDRLYRLTNEAVSITGAGSLFYQYDNVGNRISRTAGLTLPVQALSYNTNDWLTNDMYDSNGNTIQSAGTNYQYDVMNHITNATINSSQIVMTYDGDGNRVSKKANGTNVYYLVDDVNPSGYAQVLEEWAVVTGSSTNLSKVYNYGTDLINQRQPNLSTNYFIYDSHGSARMLVDNSGNTVNVMAYDAFGNLIASNGVLQTAYLYSGQQYDSDIGLYYNRARYLNIGTSRFWTMDTYEGDNEDPLSLDKYLYAEDDPVNMDDPSGNDAEENISAADNFTVNMHVGLVGLIGSTPYAYIRTGNSVTVDHIYSGENIPLNNGNVLIYDFHKRPAGSVHFEAGDFVGANLIAVPNLDDSDKVTYKWRQFVTDNDPEFPHNHDLDSDWRIHQQGDWAPNYNPSGPLPSLGAYSFSDTPNVTVSPHLEFPQSSQDYVSKVTYSFETQLVQLSDPDALTGGTVVLTIKWGFWYTLTGNGIF